MNQKETREALSANLKLLCKDEPSISHVCREMGVNRTQFNRYLFGETLPRADVLARICKYFDVDESIILLSAPTAGVSEG